VVLPRWRLQSYCYDAPICHSKWLLRGTFGHSEHLLVEHRGFCIFYLWGDEARNNQVGRKRSIVCVVSVRSCMPRPSESVAPPPPSSSEVWFAQLCFERGLVDRTFRGEIDDQISPLSKVNGTLCSLSAAPLGIHPFGRTDLLLLTVWVVVGRVLGRTLPWGSTWHSPLYDDLGSRDGLAPSRGQVGKETTQRTAIDWVPRGHLQGWLNVQSGQQ